MAKKNKVTKNIIKYKQILKKTFKFKKKKKISRAFAVVVK